MPQATQLTLLPGDEESDNGFYDALNYIRQNANTQFGKGRLFERLIRAYLLEDPFYNKRFSEVYLWGEWAENQPGFDRVDRGHRPRCHRTHGWHLRYPVQMLRRRQTYIKIRYRHLYIRIQSATVHHTDICGYRQKLDCQPNKKTQWITAMSKN